jgi:hypothetical protein
MEIGCSAEIENTIRGAIDQRCPISTRLSGPSARLACRLLKLTIRHVAQLRVRGDAFGMVPNR